MRNKRNGYLCFVYRGLNEKSCYACDFCSEFRKDNKKGIHKIKQFFCRRQLRMVNPRKKCSAWIDQLPF